MAKIFRISVLVLLCCCLYAGVLFAGQQEKASDEKEGALTKEVRIRGLVKLWAAVKYKCAVLEYAGVDWDQILPAYLEKAEKAGNLREYYLVLEEMIALVNDNHTNIENIPGRRNLYKPNLYLEPVEGQYVVTGFYHSDKSHPDVKIGDTIFAVDGKSVEKMVTEVKPYMNASSERECLCRALDRMLWRNKNKDVVLKIKRVQETFEVTFSATIPHGRHFSTFGYNFSYRLLENRYGYIRIPNFWQGQIVEEFTTAIEKLKETKGLILDLRDNGGGDERKGAQIAGRLLRERIFFCRPTLESVSLDTVQEVIDSEMKDANELKLRFCISAAPCGPWQYDRPLVLLVNWQTGSAAEGFTMGLKDCGRAYIVGETTLGSTGNPYYVKLPGGGKGRICRNKTVRLNGSRFHGVGIRPNIPVKRTIKGIAEGRDEILEAAIDYLNSAKDAQKAKGK